MKSLIQAVAVALVLGAPIASFAQAAPQQAAAQDTQAVQTQAAGQQAAAQTGHGGYGSNGHGSWQAGRGSDTTVSAYSPPIHNAR
ncbi:hypothetical protein VOM14_15120 [Paraburkholderia sp. MPAMCS5]|uniref:hypothetical protein n=1 Tax=Paraburkholderia sp. MPAMCS5 TaxID=3112563 RepID=UPI002E1914CD|nr:hypothetical protein [Paraburkholderia sp. MPAMCS5]